MAGQDSKAGQEGWGRTDQGEASCRDRTARQDKKAGEGQIRAGQHRKDLPDLRMTSYGLA
jgi:hypothetical protein